MPSQKASFCLTRALTFQPTVSPWLLRPLTASVHTPHAACHRWARRSEESRTQENGLSLAASAEATPRGGPVHGLPWCLGSLLQLQAVPQTLRRPSKSVSSSGEQAPWQQPGHLFPGTLSVHSPPEGGGGPSKAANTSPSTLPPPPPPRLSLPPSFPPLLPPLLVLTLPSLLVPSTLGPSQPSEATGRFWFFPPTIRDLCS